MATNPCGWLSCLPPLPFFRKKPTNLILQKLPPELLAEIFRCLNTEDRQSAAEVCRLFYQIIRNFSLLQVPPFDVQYLPCKSSLTLITSENHHPGESSPPPLPLDPGFFEAIKQAFLKAQQSTGPTSRFHICRLPPITPSDLNAISDSRDQNDVSRFCRALHKLIQRFSFSFYREGIPPSHIGGVFVISSSLLEKEISDQSVLLSQQPGATLIIELPRFQTRSTWASFVRS